MTSVQISELLVAAWLSDVGAVGCWSHLGQFSGLQDADIETEVFHY